MTENFADKTYRVIAASSSHFNLVKAIKETFDIMRPSDDPNWYSKLYEESGNDNCLVLRNETYDQEILIRSTTTSPSNIFVRLFKGQVDAITATGNVDTLPDVYTNERRLTSTALSTAALSAATWMGQTLWIASYDDAISIFISDSSGAYFSHGIHAGKIFAPDNESDQYLNIDGSGLILGIPTSATAYVTTTTNGGWLSFTNSGTDYYTNGRGGLIRIGENLWSNTQFAANDTLEFYSSVSNRLRLVPYTVGGATTGGDLGASAAGQIGKTKYLRQINRDFATAHLLSIPSEDVSSDQAWLCWSSRHGLTTSVHEASITGTTGFTAGQKGVILWKKGSAEIIDLTT
jgi:hypothetical protein